MVLLPILSRGLTAVWRLRSTVAPLKVPDIIVSSQYSELLNALRLVPSAVPVGAEAKASTCTTGEVPDTVFKLKGK